MPIHFCHLARSNYILMQQASLPLPEARAEDYAEERNERNNGLHTHWRPGDGPRRSTVGYSRSTTWPAENVAQDGK
jgi:hypothetical protein